MRDVAVVLAAGASSRLGRRKQLVEIDGETLVARAVRIARAAALDPVVVTGCAAEQIEAVVDAPIVHNPQWASGMGSSIACGVRALRAEAATVTVITCDQVRVEAEHLRALRAALDTTSDVAAAAYDGVIGVPAVFSPVCYDALVGLKGDAGARKLLRTGAFRVVTVEIPTARYDLDEPDDLEVNP